MKALIVEDDRVLADVVAFSLKREGFQIVQAYDGISALQRWFEDKPDLIVLDINLPKMDGFSVCQRIRHEADTPIIMLTVRDDDEDIIRGLELGADVYMTKPFSPRQLVARAQALLRRAAGSAGLSPGQRYGPPLVTNQRMASLVLGKPICLTPLEKRLLECLMATPGQTLAFEAIIEQIWGPRGGDRDTLRQLVRRLRGKIEPDPAHPTYIKTLPGSGYCLAGYPEARK